MGVSDSRGLDILIDLWKDISPPTAVEVDRTLQLLDKVAAAPEEHVQVELKPAGEWFACQVELRRKIRLF